MMNRPDATIPLDQYEALCGGCGITELAGWSSVSLSGNDRQLFLNNFCTNDVKRLTPDDHCEAFFTDVKGKIVGHGLITCRDDELVVIAVPHAAAPLVEHLDRYVIREDVELRDTTPERAYLVVGGDAALDSLESSMVDGGQFEKRANFSGTLADMSVHVIGWHWLGRWSSQGTPFACLIESSPDSVEPLQQALLDRGGIACGQEAFEAVRIEAGMPLFGTDFDAANLPQEVGRDDLAISFTKGCYLGQETVARIDALGHVNRQLAGVKFASGCVPEVGTALTHNGTEVGRVTSATFSPRLGAPLALAMVRREWLAPGTQLDSPVGPCEVVKLPVAR